MDKSYTLKLCFSFTKIEFFNQLCSQIKFGNKLKMSKKKGKVSESQWQEKVKPVLDLKT